jgi:iron complex outermembrane receptor protein
MWKSDGAWFQQYIAAFSATRAAGAPDATAHTGARAFADQGRFLPGSSGFKTAFDAVTGTSITNNGGLFADKSGMYHLKGNTILQIR